MNEKLKQVVTRVADAAGERVGRAQIRFSDDTAEAAEEGLDPQPWTVECYVGKRRVPIQGFGATLERAEGDFMEALKRYKR